MWRYVFLMLRRQPGKSALASSGFLLAACALILLSATTQTTLVRANQIISQSWRLWAIQRLFVQEGLFLAMIGTVSGVLVSLWVLTAQHSIQNIVSVPLIACGVIVLMGIVSALAILPAMRAISRMEVVDLLRAT